MTIPTKIPTLHYTLHHENNQHSATSLVTVADADHDHIKIIRIIPSIIVTTRI